VVLLRYQVGSASTEEREAGFMEVMKGEFPAIKLLSTDQYGGATRETAYKAAQNLLNRYGSEVDGIFAPNESTASGMLLALREQGLAGKVKFVGFDAGEQLLNAMRQGRHPGPRRPGSVQDGLPRREDRRRRAAPREGGPVIDTGVGFVTVENMDDPAMASIIHPPLDRIPEVMPASRLSLAGSARPSEPPGR
jgi:ribose transport system substrate-binding protein